jgi:hypothetical protein
MDPRRAGIGAIINNCINAICFYYLEFKNLDIHIKNESINQILIPKKIDNSVRYSVDISREYEIQNKFEILSAHDLYKHEIMMHKNFIFNQVFSFRNPENLAKLSAKYIDNSTLGVHLRGTDKQTEVDSIPIKKVIQTIDQFLNENNISSIYLATDELQFRTQLRKKYGKRILFNSENTISHNQMPIHFTKNRAIIDWQAITDAYLLSKCKYFAYSFSNLSHLALTFGAPNFIALQNLNTGYKSRMIPDKV